MKWIDLSGSLHRNLAVICVDENRKIIDAERKAAGDIKRVKEHWICICMLCGNMVSVSGDNIRSGNSGGCGCDRSEKMRRIMSKRNDIIKVDSGYEIVARNTGNRFKIDAEDLELAKGYCWHETEYGYLAARDPVADKIIFLHRLLVYGDDALLNDGFVDHINRDKRDCRRKNLRSCSAIENSRNKSISSRNTSGRVGVSFDKPTGKWRSYVSVKAKYISLGYYDSYEDAVRARIDGEQKYYGAFAPTQN